MQMLNDCYNYGSTKKNWISGIAITVIGGLILWFLTQPGILIEKEKPLRPSPVNADIRILKIDIIPSSAGRKANGTFSVYNDGPVIAEKCVLTWRTPSGYITLSDTFTLKPKESLDIQMKSAKFLVPGKFECFFDVEFESSEPYQRTTSRQYRKTIKIAKSI